MALCVCAHSRKEWRSVQGSLRYCRRLGQEDKNRAVVVGQALEIQETKYFWG